MAGLSSSNLTQFTSSDLLAEEAGALLSPVKLTCSQ